MADVKLDETMKDDVYTFLNDIRESGETNMFGATPYIQREFGIEKKEARAWLSSWMKDFK